MYFCFCSVALPWDSPSHKASPKSGRRRLSGQIVVNKMDSMKENPVEMTQATDENIVDQPTEGKSIEIKAEDDFLSLLKKKKSSNELKVNKTLEAKQNIHTKENNLSTEQQTTLLQPQHEQQVQQPQAQQLQIQQQHVQQQMQNQPLQHQQANHQMQNQVIQQPIQNQQIQQQHLQQQLQLQQQQKQQQLQQELYALQQQQEQQLLQQQLALNASANVINQPSLHFPDLQNIQAMKEAIQKDMLSVRLLTTFCSN